MKNIHDDLSLLGFGIHEVWRKIGLSLWRLISAQRYALVVVYHWIGLDVQEQERKSQRSFLLANIRLFLAVK